MKDAIIEKLDLEIEILEGMEKDARLTPYYTGRLHGFREARELVKKYGLANVGKRFWLTDKMEVRLLCERCDAPTTKVIIEHQKVVSEKEVQCDRDWETIFFN